VLFRSEELTDDGGRGAGAWINGGGLEDDASDCAMA